ncbi:amidohydrolase family protein [Flavihumibacter petaseus]|uniref:amidohydrolase family protein n=1 Tax=Flavihumibacter petaseus TaxID=549295 RepID=UPI001C3F3875|nr:amidohydrolase family protein [Flavihumibacter petaseus]
MILGIFSSCKNSPEKTGSRYDLVIIGGTVIDPETKLNAIQNIGIDSGVISVITNEKIEGKKTINATGLIVAPGFIDLHSHGQSLIADRMQAFDGVTTALELESGVLPIGEWYQFQEKQGRVLNYGAAAAWTFARISEMEGIPMRADLLWFQQAFSLKHWVYDPANDSQTVAIAKRIEQGIQEGSLGIGVNAGYAPGGGYKELLAVHELAARYKVPVFTHVTGDYPDDPNSAAESIGQIISYAAATGSQEHICHLNSTSRKDIATTRKLILGAQARGLPISTEAYTYGASSTTIGAALFNEEGIKRKGIRYSQIELNGIPLNDQTFHQYRKETPGAVIVFKFFDLPREHDLLDQSVLFPGGAIASDGMPWLDKATGMPVDDHQWPLSEKAFAHPRGAGTYTRLLAQWVRERHALTISEAIAKSSLIPAQILERSVPAMKRKGRLQLGMDADIILFDPATVQDNATFTNPTLPASGMMYVLVNGKLVIENGVLNPDARPGKPVRRNP